MNSFCRSIVSFGRKHDNVLFAIGEIALGTAAVIFAVKNTAKYIEDHEEDSEVDGNTPAEKAKDVGKHYWQTGVCLGGFIALRSLDCVYTGEQKREYSKALMACQAALAAKKPGQNAKKIAQNDLPEGTPLDKDGKPLEGEEMEELRDNNTYDQYGYQFWFDGDEIPDPEESVYLSDYCKRDAFYFPQTGRLIISTLADMQQAEINCRLQIQSGKDLYFNDVYKYCGAGSDGMGHDLFMKGDPSDDIDEFSFDMSPGMILYNDGFGSSDLIYVINPNRYIYNLNIPEELQ